MTEYQLHPFALVFPEMTPEEYADLKQDMRERKAKGLPPLEHPLLLYQEMLFDGRHRYKAWRELEIEGDPPVQVFSPEKHGTLAAWLRLKSLNMVRRHISADQKAAIFLKASEDVPELKAVIEQIKQANLGKQKEGKPSDAGDQGGTTAEQVGKLAGVGATAMKQVQKLKKEAPDLFEQVHQGKISAKRALQETKRRQEEADAEATDALKEGEEKGDGGVDEEKGQQPKKEIEVASGDLVYQVEPYRLSIPGSPRIVEHTVLKVDKLSYVLVGGNRLYKVDAFNRDGAMAHRKKIIQKEIAEIEAELKHLKGLLKQKATVVTKT